jgi:ribonuclease T1
MVRKLAFFFQIEDTYALGSSGLPGFNQGKMLMSGFGSLKLVLTGLCLTTVLALGPALAKAPVQVNVPGAVSLSELPKQGVQIYALIHQGGPFASERDGTVFGNRERLLPIRKRGYYLEYTVPTPGVRHRGVRRIVCGGQPRSPDACYYTADHYESFRRILP